MRQFSINLTLVSKFNIFCRITKPTNLFAVAIKYISGKL